MDEIKQSFKTSIESVSYSIIKNSIIYILQYIPNNIWENCIELKTIYESYNLNKITSYIGIVHSYIYNCLHIMLLFDHSFVTNNVKRNNCIKINKIHNDTINNILYLYCKQQLLTIHDSNFISNLKNYTFDIEYINDINISFYKSYNLSINQRINIMMHSNDNTILMDHENSILRNIFEAYKTHIHSIGKHMVTQNACLTDESP